MIPPILGYTSAVALACVLAAAPLAFGEPSADKPATERPSREVRPEQTEEGAVPGTGPALQVPGILLPPRVGLDVLYAPPPQGRFGLTPSLTLSEEFNDNIFLSSTKKRADFITQFTPGVSFAMRQPDFRLIAAYSFTAEIYARTEELSNVANRQNLVATASYQLSPLASLNLTESFSYNTNSNAASISGISSGRQNVWTNVFAPSLDFRLTPRTTWHVFGAHVLERYSAGGSQDSDLYRIGSGVDFALTPRVGLTGGYDFAYLDIRGEPAVLVHTPRVGGTYRVTPTLAATVSGGPSVVVSDRDTIVSPTGSARLIKSTTWGAMSLFYERAVGTAGGFGGPSDNQTFGGGVSASKLWPGLLLDFSPRYTIAKSENIAVSRTDVNALTLNLSASYQLARNISVVGSYTFFNQQTTARQDIVVDQNRVFIGLRFGYPIIIY